MIPIRYLDLYKASKVLPESKIRKKLQRMLLKQRWNQLQKEMELSRRQANSTPALTLNAVGQAHSHYTVREAR